MSEFEPKLNDGKELEQASWRFGKQAAGTANLGYQITQRIRQHIKDAASRRMIAMTNLRSRRQVSRPVTKTRGIGRDSKSLPGRSPADIPSHPVGLV